MNSITTFGRITAPIVIFLGASLIGLAQDPPPVPAALPVHVLREGTPVPLTFTDGLSSKTASVGDPVTLTLSQDLVLDGAVVARAGSIAAGEVTNARKAGMMGKGGELNIRLDHLTAGTSKIMLRGSKAREGDDTVGTAVALTVLFGPVGLLKHGKNIDISQGTPFTAYVADNVTVPAVN